MYRGNKAFAGSVCFGLVVLVCWVFCFFFSVAGFLFCFVFFEVFFFSLLKDTTSILLLSESTNETIHRGTKFFSYSSVENTDFGLRFCNCVFLTHETTFWSGF